MIKEITAKELNTTKFINEQVKKIKTTVGKGIAVNDGCCLVNEVESP